MRNGLRNFAVALVVTMIGFCSLELATRAVYGVTLTSTTNFVAQALDIVRGEFRRTGAR